jgi:hypothetical protein
LRLGWHCDRRLRSNGGRLYPGVEGHRGQYEEEHASAEYFPEGVFVGPLRCTRGRRARLRRARRGGVWRRSGWCGPTFVGETGVVLLPLRRIEQDGLGLGQIFEGFGRNALQMGVCRIDFVGMYVPGSVLERGFDLFGGGVLGYA